MNTSQDRNTQTKETKAVSGTTAADFDFEVWAKAVKQQMLAVVQKRK